MNGQPLKSLEGYTSSQLVDQAAQIAGLISSWKRAGTYSFAVPQAKDKVAVDIYTKPDLNNDFWVARANHFAELDPQLRKHLWQQLDDFSIGSTSSLDKCHTQYEMEYIEELYDFNVHEYTLPSPPDGFDTMSYLVELYYKLQAPLKRRKFYNLVHIARNRETGTAYVISLALDPSVVPDAKQKDAPGAFVDAQYTSVEQLRYDEELDSLEWLMTTCSDAKGNVPQWLARLLINGVVAKDVPHFLKWAAKSSS